MAATEKGDSMITTFRAIYQAAFCASLLTPAALAGCGDVNFAVLNPSTNQYVNATTSQNGVFGSSDQRGIYSCNAEQSAGER